MTHSIDSFITDSANSATALFTGHKSSVNALGVYADSSPDSLDDPKVRGTEGDTSSMSKLSRTTNDTPDDSYYYVRTS